MVDLQLAATYSAGQVTLTLSVAARCRNLAPPSLASLR